MPHEISPSFFQEEGDESLIESTQSSQVIVSRGHFFVREDHVLLPDQSQAVRRYLCHPGAVVILGQKDSSFVLIRQYRHPFRRVFWELPAGKINSQESPLEAAKREFREECGYLAHSWDFLGKIYPCISYSDEEMHLYHARELEFVGQDLDPGEYLNPFLIPQEQIKEMIETGKVGDGKSLAAFSLLSAQNRFSFS